MRTSRYNWSVRYDNKTIIYNGLSGCIAELLPESFIEYSDIVSYPSNTHIRVDEHDVGVLNTLFSQGFLVSDDVDERDLIGVLHDWQRYDSDHTALTLVMTGRCNFACAYCNQSHYLHSDITEEVIDAVLEWERSTQPRKLSIALYGGEPLLVLDVCLDFLDRLRSQRRDRKQATVNIVSNGYLLSEEASKALGMRNVESVQITIDGNRAQHDRRRILADGSPTFDRILRNALDAAKYMYVNIRVNTDSRVHSSSESIDWFDYYFKGCDKVRVYAAPTRLCSQRDSFRNLSHVKHEFPRQFYSRKSSAVLIPGCGATSLSSQVVLPDGSVKACWEEVGIESPDYGNILIPESVSFLSRYKWLTFDPSHTPPCSECKYLPTCAGGCPRDMVINKRPSCLFASDAEYERYIIENYKSRIAGKEAVLSKASDEAIN